MGEWVHTVAESLEVKQYQGELPAQRGSVCAVSTESPAWSQAGNILPSTKLASKPYYLWSFSVFTGTR